LVRPQDLQDSAFGDDDVPRDDLGDETGLEELGREFTEVGQLGVLFIGPEEGLLERLLLVVRKIFGVHAVADHEDLDVLEQACAGIERFVLVPVDLIESQLQLHASALELDLHQGQAVDQQGDVVPVFALAIHADLVADLELVQTPALGLAVQEGDVRGGTIIAVQGVLVAQNLRALHHATGVQVVQDAVEF
jgi:hypothetical protein